MYKTAFIDWFNDGNVIEGPDGYSTQDALYKNKLKNIKELYKYFLKEFVYV
jgi:hypothetical protein